MMYGSPLLTSTLTQRRPWPALPWNAAGVLPHSIGTSPIDRRHIDTARLLIGLAVGVWQPAECITGHVANGRAGRNIKPDDAAARAEVYRYRVGSDAAGNAGDAGAARHCKVIAVNAGHGFVEGNDERYAGGAGQRCRCSALDGYGQRRAIDSVLGPLTGAGGVLPAASAILVTGLRFSASVPLIPLPVLTVTVDIRLNPPAGDTSAIVAPLRPLAFNAKSSGVTLLTSSLKVIVKTTTAELLVAALVSAIVAIGAVLPIV